MPVTPYLFLDGRCEEAIEFYRKTLGAEVDMLMRFKDSPEPQQPGMRPARHRRQDHARELPHRRHRGDGVRRPMQRGSRTSRVSRSRSTPRTRPRPNGCSLLSPKAGQVQMPLMKTFFSPRFGMVADRFGVGWMIIVGRNAKST